MHWTSSAPIYQSLPHVDDASHTFKTMDKTWGQQRITERPKAISFCTCKVFVVVKACYSFGLKQYILKNVISCQDYR